MRHRRRSLLFAALVALVATSAGRSWPRADDQAAGDAIDSGDASHLAKARVVAARALQYLSSRWHEGGTFAPAQVERDPQVAATALAALAMMANGHTPDDGGVDSVDPMALQLRQSLRYLLSIAQVSECTCARVKGAHLLVKFKDSKFNDSQMHGHGYATWALAMAYGMSFGIENEELRKELADKLQGAVHCMELVQGEIGGWFYSLEPNGDHEGSVTVTVLQALRAAKEAGLRVDAGVIQRAVGYLRMSQIRGQEPRQGAFRYRFNDPVATFALTAAAVSSLNQAGDYDSKEVDLGIAFMREKDPLLNPTADENWPWYGRFYTAQAYWQYRDLRHFRSWYPALVEAAALEQSRRDGSFSDSRFGDIYATAMAALTLAVPFGWLPSFQR